MNHQHIRHDDVYAVRPQPAYGFDRLAKRTRELRNGVMYFGDVRVNADLHRFHAQSLDAVGFLLPYQDTVGLQLDVESPLAGMLQNLEEIAAHHYFAAA